MLAERLTAQLLAGPPAPDPVAVAERLLAVQGQDTRGVRLAVRARTSGLSVADVDRALTEDRSLVITWLNRGTLHLVRREDLPWLHALTAPRNLVITLRRLVQLGVPADDANRSVGVIEQALGEEGPLTRAELGARITAAGGRTEGQILIHLLAVVCLRGLAVRGPVTGRGFEQAYALVRDWLGPPPPVDREVALAELARRYLAGHGPADDRDLARWSGLPLRDVRAGLAAIDGELLQRDDGLVDLARRPEAEELPPPRLLGSFEPVLLGWTSREFVVGGHGDEIAAGAIFRPLVLIGGRAAGVWGMPRGEVVLEPFITIRAGEAAALEAEAADVVRFLDGA